MQAFGRSWRRWLAAGAAALAAGCSRPAEQAAPVSYEQWLSSWADPIQVARLDGMAARLYTSADPSDDTGRRSRKSPKGWVIVADLDGPGSISRCWFTGAESGQQRLRFFFDDARKPALDVSLAEFCGGAEPWRPPLASYENFCWYNFIPLPYRKRLVIMMQEGDPAPEPSARPSCHIQYVKLSEEQAMASFRGSYTEAERTTLNSVRQGWAGGGLAELPDGLEVHQATRVLAPGERADLLDLAGPAMVRELAVIPESPEAEDPSAREHRLRDVVLRVHWNGHPEASVETPLGDFFGQAWRPVRYRSMYFAMTNETLLSRFPMPFEHGARVSLENQGAAPVVLALRAAVQPLAAWDAAWGYLHAHWAKTTPEDAGRPHSVLAVEGRGSLAGCLLATLSLDRDWKLLEGAVEMAADDHAEPTWLDLSVEGYCHGAGSYQNVLARPTHGVPLKTFFRAVQYRLHPWDAPRFNAGFRKQVDRGRGNATRGHVESVVWYYLAAPAAAASNLGSASDRVPPVDPLAEPTIMTELINYERLGDYRAARDAIESLLRRNPKYRFAPILRLRQIAYDERMEGFAAVRERYERFLATEKDQRALTQARLLMWFHEKPTHALLGLSGTARTRAVLDGLELATVEKAENPVFVAVRLEPGRHALALHTVWNPPPNWVQAGLRTHEGFIGTATDWTCQFKPPGAWGSRDYDDRSWRPVDGPGVAGPPQEPKIFITPNAFVDLQAQAAGLRATEGDWPDPRGFFVYRHRFETR